MLHFKSWYGDILHVKTIMKKFIDDESKFLQYAFVTIMLFMQPHLVYFQIAYIALLP
jgi:hypothetical protein